MPDRSTILPQSPTSSPAARDVMPVPEQVQNEHAIQPLYEMAIQFKLSVGAVNDPLETEADAMADTIMRMPEQNFIQRQCSQCEEEEKLQRKPLASFIQRKESSAGTVASEAITNQINSSKGSGSSMDSDTQRFMQSRFGTDFSHVKIHTGHESVQMNRELNAKAFTVGNDIYFNAGQYNPNSGEGKHLLAHELTHTVQQGGVGKKAQKKKNDETESAPGGLCVKSFFGGEVKFNLLNSSELNNIAVINEDDNAGLVQPPVNGVTYDCDGFWYRGISRWFKIPDHCKVDVFSSPSSISGFYTSCCNIAAGIFRSPPAWTDDQLDNTKSNPFN